jgi:hypothetical protein
MSSQRHAIFLTAGMTALDSCVRVSRICSHTAMLQGAKLPFPGQRIFLKTGQTAIFATVISITGDACEIAFDRRMSSNAPKTGRAFVDRVRGGYSAVKAYLRPPSRPKIPGPPPRVSFPGGWWEPVEVVAGATVYKRRVYAASEHARRRLPGRAVLCPSK